MKNRLIDIIPLLTVQASFLLRNGVEFDLVPSFLLNAIYNRELDTYVPYGTFGVGGRSDPRPRCTCFRSIFTQLPQLHPTPTIHGMHNYGSLQGQVLCSSRRISNHLSPRPLRHLIFAVYQ